MGCCYFVFIFIHVFVVVGIVRINSSPAHHNLCASFEHLFPIISKFLLYGPNGVKDFVEHAVVLYVFFFLPKTIFHWMVLRFVSEI